MGCGSSWVCHTCRVWLYVGYGSYRRHGERIAAYVPQKDHEGHDTHDWIDDAEWGREADTLWGMGPRASRGEPIIEGISSYTYRNLQRERDEAYARENPPKPLPELTGNPATDAKLASWRKRTGRMG